MSIWALTQAMEQQKKKPPCLQVVIAIILVLILVAVLFWTIYMILTVDRGMEIFSMKSETAQIAATLFFDKMTAMAQLTLAILGGAWAFITLADTQIRIEGFPAIACFATASIAFIVSLFVYAYGYDFIVSRIFYHATFDIDAPFIKIVNESQQLLFLDGCLDIGLFILLGRRSI